MSLVIELALTSPFLCRITLYPIASNFRGFVRFQLCLMLSDSILLESLCTVLPYGPIDVT